MKSIKDFFLGPDGDTSSKRLFLFLFVLLAALYIVVNLFWGKELKASVEEYLFYTIWGFFFGVAADRWRKNAGAATAAGGGGDRPKDPPPNP
jgi:hypothetical protein